MGDSHRRNMSRPAPVIARLAIAALVCIAAWSPVDALDAVDTVVPESASPAKKDNDHVLALVDANLGQCQSRSTFNAGWGTCPTYASSNRNWCRHDRMGNLLAEQACSECGKCSDAPPPPPPPASPAAPPPPPPPAPSCLCWDRDKGHTAQSACPPLTLRPDQVGRYHLTNGPGDCGRYSNYKYIWAKYQHADGTYCSGGNCRFSSNSCSVCYGCWNSGSVPCPARGT